MSGSHKKGKLLIALGAAWDEALVAEFERFPYGSHDDQVDACSLAFNQLWEFGGGDTTMIAPTDIDAAIRLIGQYEPPSELVEYQGSLPSPVAADHRTE